MARWTGGRMRYLRSASIILWVVACLSPLPGAAQEKATRINLGYSSISGSQAILRVTKDAGIFSKNGLDVSLVLIAGGSGIIQALIAGDLPIAVVSGEPSILARLQGADTVILGGLINIIDFSIITAPEVKTPQDLKGKKLGVSRFGSSTDFCCSLRARQVGACAGSGRRDSSDRQSTRAPRGAEERHRPRHHCGPPCRYRCP